MTQEQRLLERLRQGPVTNAEIVRQLGIFNSTGRISDLRKKHDIQATQIRKGLWEYRLIKQGQGELI